MVRTPKQSISSHELAGNCSLASRYEQPAARVLISAGLILAVTQFGLVAQQRPLNARRPARKLSAPATTLHSGEQLPRYKGIWEPVNFPEDVGLMDVFFVSDQVGWVSGAASLANGAAGGFILHTKDGGAHWLVQLGDPKSSDPAITKLRFLDATHGWALQGDKLLRTSDGENWELAGSVPAWTADYVFTSPTRGIALAGNQFAFLTGDGGRTWKQVFQCAARLEVNGLTRSAACNLNAVHFPSSTVGYAVGGDYGFFVVAKTEDGGAGWKVIYQDAAASFGTSVFFTAGDTGFTATFDRKIYATTDGGRSWHGLAGSGPGRISFADPEVGWSVGNYGQDLSFTTDGGRHWNSRTTGVPDRSDSYALPSRNRAYLVGNHGMIYRYRVVPVTYTPAAHAIDAPVMPRFDSPVFREVATLNDVVAKLRAKLHAPAFGQAGAQTPMQPGGQATVQKSAQSGGFEQDTGTPAGGGTGAAPGSTTGADAAGSGGFQQDSGAAGGGFVDSCCGALFQQLETTATAFATDVPVYSQRFRNLNLILQGLNFLNSIINQANTLKQSIRALRQAKDAQAAAAALNTVQTQVNGISSSGGFVQDTSLPQQP